MATQRPPWFRLPTMRPPAPTPPPAPAPATTTPRPPAIVRPAIPIRPPPPPQEPAPASQPPTAPPSPPAPPKPTSPVASTTPSPPPRSPVSPRPSPPRAPVVSSPPPPPPPSSPVTKSASVPTSSPQINTQTPSSPSPSPSPSPSSKPTPTPPLPTAETANLNKATPLSSPKPLNKPSHETKASSRPPSPLQLPPAQMRPSEEDREPKIEQKSVLVQESIEKPTKANNAHTLHSIPSKAKREPPTKDKGTIKKLSDSEDTGMRVITIAGENRGALMEITSSNKKKHPHGTAYTLANDTTGDHKDKNPVAQSQPPMATFLNSNVQGVNNSIVFNSSCHHNDPGIHLSIVRKLNASRGNHHG